MIKVLKQVMNKYERFGTWKAGELLLRPEDALSLANELEEMEIVIFGVDVWYYVVKQIVEDPGSLDISDITDGDNRVRASAKAAREFIKNKLPEGTAFVSFIMEEDNQYGGN